MHVTVPHRVATKVVDLVDLFLIPYTRARTRMRARARSVTGIAPRSTTSTRNRKSLESNRLSVVDLLPREVHHLAVQRVGMP